MQNTIKHASGSDEHPGVSHHPVGRTATSDTPQQDRQLDYLIGYALMPR